MIATLASTSPWVWLGSGLRLSVQLTKVALSPEKSRSMSCESVMATLFRPPKHRHITETRSSGGGRATPPAAATGGSAALLEPRVRERRGGDRGQVVADDHAEPAVRHVLGVRHDGAAAGDLALPLLAEGRDLLVAAP